MAVPARRNGEEEEDDGLFDQGEGEGWADVDSDVPPHLRPLADAVQRGDVEALRNALGNFVRLFNLIIADLFGRFLLISSG